MPLRTLVAVYDVYIIRYMHATLHIAAVGPFYGALGVEAPSPQFCHKFVKNSSNLLKGPKCVQKHTQVEVSGYEGLHVYSLV